MEEADVKQPGPAPAPAVPQAVRRFVSPDASHKIAVGAGGGSFVVVLVWLLKVIWKVDVPVEVGMAMGASITTLLSIFVPTFGDTA